MLGCNLLSMALLEACRAELENMGEELEDTADNDGTARLVHEEALQAHDSSSMRTLSRQNQRSSEAKAGAEDGQTATIEASEAEVFQAQDGQTATITTLKADDEQSNTSSPVHRVDAEGRRISRFWSEEPQRGLTDAFGVSAVSAPDEVDSDSGDSVATVCDRCGEFHRRGDEELEAMGDITCCCKPIDQELEAMGIPVHEAETFQLETQVGSPEQSHSSKRAKWATPTPSPSRTSSAPSPPSQSDNEQCKQVEYF